MSYDQKLALSRVPSPNFMSLTAGKVLQNGKYVLLDIIGQGGFGITYKATHVYLGQPVVIKTLNESLRCHEDFDRFQQQFMGEAQRLAKFQHPNIVRVLDFFEEAGQSFIVMDYIPGPTLAELIKQGQPLPENLAIHYIRQIGSALSVIHQHGLLHRDVKPQNIIRREGTQTVVLIDFGIAREFTPGVTQTQTGMLSAGYAPIEQYLPRGKRGPATDVYALAATLYTLVTTQSPVASALRDRIPLPTPRQLVPSLSPALEYAILRGLEIEAEVRPQTISEWLALLPETRPFSDESIKYYSYLGDRGSDMTQTIPPHSERAAAGYGSQPQIANRYKIWSNQPTPNYWGLRILGITAAIAILAGIGFGLTVRLGGSGAKLLQREQSFPPTDNWPGVEPITPNPTPPEPNLLPDTQPTQPPQPTQPVIQQNLPPVSPQRSRRKRLRPTQPQQTPLPQRSEKNPSNRSPLNREDSSAAPAAISPAPTISPNTTETPDSAISAPAPTATPAAIIDPEPPPSAPAVPANSPSSSANPPSDPKPPAEAPQLLPTAPATEQPVAPPTENPPTP